jgi:hypothetical protein
MTLAKGVMLVAIALALAAAMGTGCSVQLDGFAGRACDDSHPCTVGEVCSNAVCVSGGTVDGGAEAGTDAAADDATPPSNAEIYPDGTFETGCAPWEAFNGTASTSTTAHGGSKSCQICSDPGGGYTLDDKGFLNSPAPGRYHARAWVRVAPGHPQTAFGILLRTVNQPRGPNFEEVEKATTNVPYADGWQAADVDLDVTLPADVLNVVVYGQTPSCILVDDVSAERLP